MGVFKRMGDLLSANLNELVERCENPERTLKQAIREMEGALGRTLDGAARAIAQERLLIRQLSEHRREADRFRREAEAAVGRGDDLAARQALRCKGEHVRMLESLPEQLVTAESLSVRLRNQVSAMRVRLAEARRRLVDIAARSRAAEARRQFAGSLQQSGSNGAMTCDLDRAAARTAQQEAETEALLELLGCEDQPAAFDEGIEAELRALKETAGHVAP